MPDELTTEDLRVDVENGKYTAIIYDNGTMRFLRYGEPWPPADEEYAHSKFMRCIVHELDEARRDNAGLRLALEPFASLEVPPGSCVDTEVTWLKNERGFGATVDDIDEAKAALRSEAPGQILLDREKAAQEAYRKMRDMMRGRDQDVDDLSRLIGKRHLERCRDKLSKGAPAARRPTDHPEYDPCDRYKLRGEPCPWHDDDGSSPPLTRHNPCLGDRVHGVGDAVHPENDPDTLRRRIAELERKLAAYEGPVADRTPVRFRITPSDSLDPIVARIRPGDILEVEPGTFVLGKPFPVQGVGLVPVHSQSELLSIIEEHQRHVGVLDGRIGELERTVANYEQWFTFARGVDHERVAQCFHEHYELLAPEFGYQTREASRKPWSDVPANNRRLMVATVQGVTDEILSGRDPSFLRTPPPAEEPAPAPTWEEVCSDDEEDVCRLTVDGGWLYRTRQWNPHVDSTTATCVGLDTVFVADRSQSGLLDLVSQIFDRLPKGPISVSPVDAFAADRLDALRSMMDDEDDEDEDDEDDEDETAWIGTCNEYERFDAITVFAFDGERCAVCAPKSLTVLDVADRLAAWKPAEEGIWIVATGSDGLPITEPCPSDPAYHHLRFTLRAN